VYCLLEIKWLIIKVKEMFHVIELVIGQLKCFKAIYVPVPNKDLDFQHQMS